MIPDGRKWVIVAGESGHVTLPSAPMGHEIVDKWRGSDDLSRWDHRNDAFSSDNHVVAIALTGLKLRGEHVSQVTQ